mgnify:CR=1 FL=1
MIREVKFESQDRRIKGIIAALNANGIKDIEEANAICEAAGLDPYKTCEETQPICFENAKWAYVVGADIAIKSGDVYLGFVDRFSGTLILTGRISAVESAVKAVIHYFQNDLGYATCPVTKK